ncbi:hypothetical protein V6R21_00740 [Limibacter armeniacum]
MDDGFIAKIVEAGHLKPIVNEHHFYWKKQAQRTHIWKAIGKVVTEN